MSAPGGEFSGRAANLSVGGAFVAGVPPIPAGTPVSLDLELGDGEPPIAADAQVVWARETAQPEGPAGVALRFSRIAHDGLQRLTRLVSRRAEAAAGLLRRRVRVRLPGLESPLRAVARDVTAETVIVESEIGWLQLGSAVSTELSPSDVRNGRLRWVGVDVAPSGAARLRLGIDVSGRGLISETQEEAKFFAGEPVTPPPSLSPSGAYDSLEIEIPRPRPRRMAAMLCGVALGCLVGGGLHWYRPQLGLRLPGFLTRMAAPDGQIIQDEADEPPPSYRYGWRVVPAAE